MEHLAQRREVRARAGANRVRHAAAELDQTRQGPLDGRCDREVRVGDDLEAGKGLVSEGRWAEGHDPARLRSGKSGGLREAVENEGRRVVASEEARDERARPFERIAAEHLVGDEDRFASAADRPQKLEIGFRDE